MVFQSAIQKLHTAATHRRKGGTLKYISPVEKSVVRSAGLWSDASIQGQYLSITLSMASEPPHLGQGLGRKELYLWNIFNMLRTGTWGKDIGAGQRKGIKGKPSPTGKLKTPDGRRSI